MSRKEHVSVVGAVGLFAAMLCAAVGALWLFGVAGAQNERTVGDPDRARGHVTVLNSGGRFTGPGHWPPAPHEARAPRVQQARTADPERQQTIARLTTHGDLAAQLGDRYSLISSGHPPAERAGARKGELDRSALETTWFSHSTNRTVIATSDAAGVRVYEVRTVAPGDMQPEFSDEEDARAINLARVFWQELGADHVDDLEGFSIWALREDGRVFDVRMAYVSFHRSREHEPELTTWVDLTNETIVRSEVIG